MRKPLAFIIKEALLLWRDKGGLAMLFVMPMVLILIMTLLQDSSFKELDEKNIPVLFLNHDTARFGTAFGKNFNSVRFFDIHNNIDGKPLTDELLKRSVAEGKFLVGVVVHKNATEKINRRILFNIKRQMGDAVQDDSLPDDEQGVDSSASVEIYFDPAIKTSFKLSITSAIRQISFAVESEMLFDNYRRILKNSLGITVNKPEKQLQPVIIKQQYATTLHSEQIPNSVQHNVPAWTIFAMFFIVIPLSGNIIGERNGGIVKRLATIPGALLYSDLAKMVVYLLIGVVQAFVMIAVGMYLLPLLGLPRLHPGTHFTALFTLIVVTALAAASFGLFTGTFFTSRDQSAVFGSISVVILAAVGGIWVPVFVMSDILRQISKLSPLNWAINAFYNIFLRDSGIAGITHYLLYLLLFSFVTVGLSVWKMSLQRKR